MYSSLFGIWNLPFADISLSCLSSPRSIGTILKKLRKKFQDKLGEASTVADEAISSIRTVRSFSNEEKAKKDYSKYIDESYGLGKELAKAIGM